MDSQNTIQQLRKACEEWGFFLITNHGIPKSQIDAFKQALQGWFHLPKTEKSKVKRTHNNSRGWADDELTKQKRDLKEIFDFGHVPDPNVDDAHPNNHVMDGYNQWPEEAIAPGFRHIVKEWYATMHHLSITVLSAMMMSFQFSTPNMSAQVISSHFTNHTSFLRLNWYPLDQHANPDTPLGISRHTDAGMLTVLWQDGPALQVYTGYKEDFKDGEWVDVPVVEDAFVVNIGDMFHVWTGGICSAPEHRVLASSNMGRERFSAPFFLNPAYAANFTPMLMEEMPQRYRTINWGDFRLKRFRGDFYDLGKESQIEDWLVD